MEVANHLLTGMTLQVGGWIQTYPISKAQFSDGGKQKNTN